MWISAFHSAYRAQNPSQELADLLEGLQEADYGAVLRHTVSWEKQQLQDADHPYAFLPQTLEELRKASSREAMVQYGVLLCHAGVSEGKRLVAHGKFCAYIAPNQPVSYVWLAVNPQLLNIKVAGYYVHSELYGVRIKGLVHRHIDLGSLGDPLELDILRPPKETQELTLHIVVRENAAKQVHVNVARATQGPSYVLFFSVGDRFLHAMLVDGKRERVLPYPTALHPH